MSASVWIHHPLLAWAALLPVPLGALWMALAPQLPQLRERRALLAWATWLATRPFFLFTLRALTLPDGRPAWTVVLPHDGPPALGGPWLVAAFAFAHVPFGGLAAALLALAADLVAWRVLARVAGEASEVAWCWVAAPLVWYLAAFAGGVETLGAAALVLAWALARRGRAVPAGLVLALGVALAGPLALLPALALALGVPRRVPFAAAFAFAFGAACASAPLLHVPALAFVWPEPAAFGTGPTLWRVPLTFVDWEIGALGALPLLVVIATGALRLVARGEDAEAHTACSLGAFAALAPALAPAALVLWAPLACAWSGGDPDRRGWWLLWSAVVPLAAWLDAGPLQGALGPTWRLLAALGIVGAAVLALWPVQALWRSPAAEVREG